MNFSTKYLVPTFLFLGITLLLSAASIDSASADELAPPVGGKILSSELQGEWHATAMGCSSSTEEERKQLVDKQNKEKGLYNRLYIFGDVMVTEYFLRRNDCNLSQQSTAVSGTAESPILFRGEYRQASQSCRTALSSLIHAVPAEFKFLFTRGTVQQRRMVDYVRSKIETVDVKTLTVSLPAVSGTCPENDLMVTTYTERPPSIGLVDPIEAYEALIMVAAKNGNMVLFEDIYKEAKSFYNTEARDRDGNTALLIAAKNGHANIVKRLIEIGASTKAKNRHGETAESFLEQKTP